MTPFELHLTTAPLPDDQLDGFVALCRQLDAKPLLIELARGAVMQQPMLSKVQPLPDLPAALALAAADARQLQAGGFAVQRVKIEVPLAGGHLATPGAGAAYQPYFEWHGKVAYERAAELLALCQRHGAHLSANGLRDAAGTRIVTLREYGTQATFEARVAALTRALQASWPVQKSQAECCLYDSNAGLDRGWLTT
ncbi:hypothetical protein EJV47_21345 [Hymenobacter gummosus]|uniref:Uncharacterized protein n=1 Tax=Hymenobacter gummosus TaxID=1776032 RepID=A0A431TXX9_9BACT|nr:hypothetical protein [Hymenobacter gummosus]RTQ46502.1 hypothetical protein EJV47_21345 [Hymenobacter gummosus]